MTHLDRRDAAVVAYLEHRTRVGVPGDLVPSVLRALDDTGPASESSRGWLAPVLAVAGSLVLAVASLAWLSNNAASGPAPSGSPSPSAPVSEPELVDEGATVELAAVDTEGQWGSVTVTRGPDSGGYRDVANVDLDPAATDISGMFFHNDPDRFYVEFQVAYAAERNPVADVGRNDWLLIGGDGDLVAPISVSVIEPELMMGTEASDIVSTPLKGRLAFAVPRDLAAGPLSLVYEPAGGRILVREPGPPPATVPDAQPPAPVTYIGREGSPITVIDSASADALFTAVRTCTDPAAGFSIDYPATWTVTGSDDTPCARFEPPTARDLSRAEQRLATRGSAGHSVQMGGPALAGSADPITAVGPLGAFRSELVGVGGGFIETGSLQYAYLIGLDGPMLDEAQRGRAVFLETGWDLDLDPEAYRERKAVIDRMVASLVVPTTSVLVTGPATCSDRGSGFQLTVPAGWYALESIEDDPSCRAFSTAPFGEPAGFPRGQRPSLTVEMFRGGSYRPGGTIANRDVLSINDHPALRLVVRGGNTSFLPPSSMATVYIIALDGELPSDTSTGRWLALSSTTLAGDPEENDAALDVIANSVEDIE